ncbi:hypothetical protein D3C76_1753560 [compost metagenome]
MENILGIQVVIAYLGGKLYIFKGIQVGNQIIELKHKTYLLSPVFRQFLLAETGYILPVN